MKSLLSYDADGNVVATLDYMVAKDDAGNVIGLIDFAAHEAAGGEHTDIWRVGGGTPVSMEPQEGEVPIPFDGSPSASHLSAAPRSTEYVPGTEWSAKGSKVWPEWLGSAAHDFRVELAGKAGKKHIAALVHKTSGHRRERAAIEAAIQAVEPDANGARDIRHIVGGPSRSLTLDADGKNAPRLAAMGTPAHLPIIGR